MLGVIPVWRKDKKSVFAVTAWNLFVLAPFIIAYWVITENHHGANQSCFGIPWDVANFLRWGLLALAIYYIITIPLNLMAIKKDRKLNQGYETGKDYKSGTGNTYGTGQTYGTTGHNYGTEQNRVEIHDKVVVRETGNGLNDRVVITHDRKEGEGAGTEHDEHKKSKFKERKEQIKNEVNTMMHERVVDRTHGLQRRSKLTEWMRMLDTLAWLFNWAMWFYVICGLANRWSCYTTQVNGLLWATVWISALFALIGLILFAVWAAKLIQKLMRQIKLEEKVDAEIEKDKLAGRNIGHDRFKEGGRVEEVEIKKSEFRHEVENVDRKPEIKVDYVSNREGVYNTERTKDVVIDKGESEVVTRPRLGIEEEIIKKQGIDDLSRRDEIRRDEVRMDDVRRDAERTLHRYEAREEPVTEIRQETRYERNNDAVYDTRDERLDVGDSDDGHATHTNDIRIHDYHARHGERRF